MLRSVSRATIVALVRPRLKAAPERRFRSLGRCPHSAFSRNRNRPDRSGFFFTQPVDMSFDRSALLWIAACRVPIQG
jgi:hypothetical protein